MKLLQIPFSGGGLGKGNGAHAGPQKVCELLVNQFTNEQGQTPTFQSETLTLDEHNIQESHKIIQEVVGALTQKAILLGGDHSITAPCVKGFKKNTADFWFIVFDAHPDLMDNFDPPTQEDYLRVLIEQGVVDASKIILVGLRNWDIEELDYLKQQNIRHYTAKTIFEKGIRSVMQEIKDVIDGPIYLSLDIDVVDPVEAIGTGYIEHGGLSSRELIYSVQELKATGKLAMCDLVEINPEKDIRDITASLGAKLVIELGDF